MDGNVVILWLVSLAVVWAVIFTSIRAALLNAGRILRDEAAVIAAREAAGLDT